MEDQTELNRYNSKKGVYVWDDEYLCYCQYLFQPPAILITTSLGIYISTCITKCKKISFYLHGKISLYLFFFRLNSFAPSVATVFPSCTIFSHSRFTFYKVEDRFKNASFLSRKLQHKVTI